MIDMKGQLLSCDGPGCFFLVHEDATGDYHVGIYSHICNGRKLTLADWDGKGLPGEEVDSIVVGSMKQALIWLNERLDY